MTTPNKTPPPATITHNGITRYYDATRDKYCLAPDLTYSEPTAPAKPTKFERGLEKALQTACEGLLSRRGYVRPTGDTLAADTLVAGWFVHLHGKGCKGQPILPDLLIMDAGWSRCLAVELKTCERYQPGQREAIESGAWKLARSYDEFAAVLTEWEGGQ